MELVRSMMRTEYPQRPDGIPKTRDVCATAAYANDMDYLRWAYQMGFEMDERCTILAAFHNNFEMLYYLHQLGCPWNEKVTLVASRFGHTQIFDYAKEHGCPVALGSRSTGTASRASKGGNTWSFIGPLLETQRATVVQCPGPLPFWES